MQKVKTFRAGLFGGRNKASKKAEKYAARHGYLITNLQLSYSGRTATAVMTRVR